MTTERRYTPAEVAALLDATSRGQEPPPAIRITPPPAANPFQAMVRDINAALEDAQAERRFEESVQHRLSDLRHEGTWWTYGHVDPTHPDDEVQGYGCWLECTVGRESDTGVWLSEPEWSSWEGAADEAAARAEATRRNRGEG